MEDLTKGDKRSIRRGLAELFTFLGQEEGGITAGWYPINSYKNKTLKPGKGSEPFEPFDNPILPLSQLFRLREVRTNKVLLACGILEPLKKGKHSGRLLTPLCSFPSSSAPKFRMQVAPCWCALLRSGKAARVVVLGYRRIRTVPTFSRVSMSRFYSCRYDTSEQRCQLFPGRVT